MGAFGLVIKYLKPTLYDIHRYRIGPFEVESVLIEHPAVVESAVVSSPDSLRGEVVKAFVVLADNYKNHKHEDLIVELQNYVKQNTAPYKYPRKVIILAVTGCLIQEAQNLLKHSEEI